MCQLVMVLLHSTRFLPHATGLHITLLRLYLTLLESTLIYIGYTSLYMTLHYSSMLYFTILDSSLL